MVSVANNSVSPWKIKIVPVVLVVYETIAKTNFMALIKCCVHQTLESHHGSFYMGVCVCYTASKKNQISGAYKHDK